MRWRGRVVPVLCIVLVSVLAMTACGGSDTLAAAPTATEADPPAVEQVEPTGTPSETSEPATSEPATEQVVVPGSWTPTLGGWAH